MEHITLTTLPQAATQEVFNQGARHLLTQMDKSTRTDGMCVYHAENVINANGILDNTPIPT